MLPRTSIPRGVLASLLLLAVFATPGQAIHQRTFISIPILGVIDQGGKAMGETHYLAIQVDRLADLSGPRLQFNEGSRAFGTFKGAALSPDWKDAARSAVDIAARATNEDARTWLVTLKNVSTAYITDGSSASAAVAVAIIAAVRHTPMLSKVALTGAIASDGRILPVGGLPEKIQGAAAGGLATVLIPKGETRTHDWDVRPLSESLRITVIEVGTLGEAYEKMTGQPF
ncbi:MAG: hypothetical protein EPO02_12335 [Nitrospirae bacterium]|nr:MAG: hypothetical protein EPO02_12335 [Nitrospirota bacterium]